MAMAFEASICPKYFEATDCLIATSRTNMPMGSLPKSTMTEKEYLLLGIYWAFMEMADRSPLMILAERTLLHLFLQSTALSRRAWGR